MSIKNDIPKYEHVLSEIKKIEDEIKRQYKKLNYYSNKIVRLKNQYLKTPCNQEIIDKLLDYSNRSTNLNKFIDSLQLDACILRVKARYIEPIILKK